MDFLRQDIFNIQDLSYDDFLLSNDESFMGEFLALIFDKNNNSI